MGIIIKQSFWGLFVIYAGVLLGYVSTLIIFPAYLSVDQIGLVRLVQSNGLLLTSFAVVGIPSTWIQVFPRFEGSSEDKSGGFTSALLLALISNLILVAIIFISLDYIKLYFEEKSALYNQYILISVLIFISQSFFEIFAAFSQSNLNIVTPAYFKEIHLRAMNLLLIVLFGVGIIELTTLIYLIGVTYLLTSLTFCLLTAIKQKYTPVIRKKFFKKEIILTLLRYAGYFSVISMASAIVLYAGQLITAKQLGLESNGILTTCLMIVAVIEMPRRALVPATIPYVSKYISSGSHNELQVINEKVSLNLLIISLLIFFGVAFNLGDLFLSIPNGEKFIPGYWVVIIGGFEKAMIMSFGLTSEIFTYSKLKRWNILLLVISSLLTILLSLIFIPKFGILGAVGALFIVQFINQMIRVIWIKITYKILPFSLGQIKLIIPAGLTLLVIFLIPFNFPPYINILIKSILITITFIGTTLILKISPEMDNFYKKFLKMIKL